MASSGGGYGTTASNNLTLARANISVTSINCDNTVVCSSTITTMTNDLCNNSNNNHFVGNITAGCSGTSGGGVRISVPKMEESDESDSELANIENTTTAIVKMRTANRNETVPRPMSWEGELSETEEDDMDGTVTDATVITHIDDPPNIVSFISGGQSDISNNFQTIPTFSVSNERIKTEYGEYKIDAASQMPATSNSNKTINSNYPPSSPLMPHLLDLKKEGVTKKIQPDLNALKFELGNHDITAATIIPTAPATTIATTTTTNLHSSPVLMRSKTTLLPANPSPDSAIHSVYTHSSPSQSPLTSRNTLYTPSLSRNNSDASHSSCYSYSSEFSPTHSPIQSRHMYGNNFNGSPLHHSVLYRPLLSEAGGSGAELNQQRQNTNTILPDDGPLYDGDQIPSAGISRQQLINSPCPICGDKISGFHYGIFSCESCKGFFKRTVQNRKNYVCLRGAACPVTIATRKKCPACRFEKCLQRGMKLEAIREDRTRGGRSTYQCSYTLPNAMLSPSISGSSDGGGGGGSSSSSISIGMQSSAGAAYRLNGPIFKMENPDGMSNGGGTLRPSRQTAVPPLLQEIMDVEHLWQFNESELSRLNQTQPQTESTGTTNSDSDLSKNPLLASAGIINTGGSESSNSGLIANLCSIADHRLYKIVKWCKSLPLFKHISIDDQICLLINAWCELLLFSCCYRSMTTPGEVRIGAGKSINLAQARSNGLHACIERMLNLTDHLRRLRVDKYEYVAMKVIVLLQSDTSELVEPEKVRASQEKALQALQAYTLSHYPDSPAKFGELLLRIPELQRTCQVGKEMLTVKSKDGEDFNILMELLRGEH